MTFIKRGKNMKLILLTTFFLLMLSGSELSAQENPLDFFPYHDGDVWQYFVGSDDGSYIETLKITKIDTVGDSLHYLYYNNGSVPSYKVNINSKIVYQKHIVENDFYPLYELDIPIDSFWVSDSSHEYWTFFYSSWIGNYFGFQLKTRQLYVYYGYPIGVFNANPQVGVWLVENIGFYKDEYDGGSKWLLGCIIDGRKFGTITSINEAEQNVNHQTKTVTNYPNPFNPTTTIEYYLDNEAIVILEIFDQLGRRIRVLEDKSQDVGKHRIVFEGSDLASGVYYYRLLVKDKKGEKMYLQGNKMVLLK